MTTLPRKIAALYGVWFMFWLLLAIYGSLFSNHGEFGVIAHLWLIITGIPLSLLSLHVMPNGSVFGVFLAGVIGLIQWCAVAVLSVRWDAWRKRQKNNTK
jgi:hypothetical protein